MSRTISPTEKSSRTRLLVGADRLFRRVGYRGASIVAIAKESKAPVGSVYFYFPKGKEELAIAALRHGATKVSSGMGRALDGGHDAADSLARCARAWAAALHASGWNGSCPVASTVLQMSDSSEGLRQASLEILDEWQSMLAACLQRHGIGAARARAIAEQALALLEGAELLARVRRSREPLNRAAGMMRKLCESA